MFQLWLTLRPCLYLSFWHHWMICWQLLFAVNPWTTITGVFWYRSNFKTWRFLGNQCSWTERLYCVISKHIYGCLFVEDIWDNYICGKRNTQSENISRVCVFRFDGTVNQTWRGFLPHMTSTLQVPLQLLQSEKTNQKLRRKTEIFSFYFCCVWCSPTSQKIQEEQMCRHVDRQLSCIIRLHEPTEENQILVTDCTILFHLFNLSLKYNSDKSSKQKPWMACVSVSFYLPLPLGSSSALCCHVKHQLESILHQYEFPSSSFCCHLKNVKCWNCLKHVWAACREKPALQKWFHLKWENNPSAEKEAAMTAWLYVSCWPP